MLTYLIDYLDNYFDIPGTGMFQFISFRAALAVITSLTISLIFGHRLINYLKRRLVGEVVRDLGLEGQMEKQGTPTMGGLIILAAIVIPTLLFAKLNNIYIILILITTIWLGFIGFVDDYIKVFRKNKKGLAGHTKILGQIIIGLIIGLSLYFHPDVVIREKMRYTSSRSTTELSEFEKVGSHTRSFSRQSSKSTKTTIPFFKNNELDYALILKPFGERAMQYAWLVFVPIVILIIVAVSNGVNLTDGIDGLATGTSAIAGVTLGLLAWVSGNYVFADYLNIMYLPDTGELTIFVSAFVGACTGFLWYNTYPAQVFMGDTG
ncbi:MAG TPA: phospho-N-acetylmuramoyl-pentapeptide-transferase, partial [Bacteroidales bacterium]|nr:phospho-N-acetylmuramoyl-pentapeptide-transferase [Bacteroidales bacterium]